MAKCVCGSRPKRGAPPLSVIQLQDVALPIFNFGSNPFQIPPSPPGFSAIWVEDTVTLCARDPDRLYLEFAPYGATLLTAALKRLWTKNCECAPVIGLWEVSANFKITNCNAVGVCSTSDFPNQTQREGASVGFRVIEGVSGGSKTSRIEAYVFSNGYSVPVTLFSQSVPNNPGSKIVATYAQRLLSPGCLPSPGLDPPLPPEELPYPYPVTPPLTLPIPYYLPDPIPIPKPKPPPPPPECCDCC